MGNTHLNLSSLIVFDIFIHIRLYLNGLRHVCGHYQMDLTEWNMYAILGMYDTEAARKRLTFK